MQTFFLVLLVLFAVGSLALAVFLFWALKPVYHGHRPPYPVPDHPPRPPARPSNAEEA